MHYLVTLIIDLCLTVNIGDKVNFGDNYFTSYRKLMSRQRDDRVVPVVE